MSVREERPGVLLLQLAFVRTAPFRRVGVKTAEGENYTLIDKLRQTAKFEGAKDVITIDGLRVEYKDGFGLARPSNTTPVVVLRFEADDEAALKRIQDDFRKSLLAVKPDAKLPF